MVNFGLLEKILSLTIKDMKGWLRNPFLIIIAIVPLMIVATFVGLLVFQAESMPAGIILKDDDSLALEIKDYIISMKSGTGLSWFNIEDLSSNKTLERFEEGQILCVIVIPENISARIQTGEIVNLEVMINNVNDDVTKNVLQRVQEVCNHFNERLDHGGVVLYAPDIEFETIASIDVSFTHYISAAVLALTVLVASGVNVATTTAKEFEDDTIKELIMAVSPIAVITGKILTGTLQTIICFGVISLTVFLLHGFIPVGNPLMIFFLILWGIMIFSNLGFLFASKLKSVVPAAVSLLVLNIAGWWVGGGLVPPEVWPGVMKVLAWFWPGTY
ncbi:MAG: ABC transporter permease, partial [Candidatus Hodarchaeota archaeon]